MLHSAAASTPTIPAGIVTIRIWPSDTGAPLFAVIAIKVVTAAATGLAVIPICEATLEIAIGRSGRILVLSDTSAITGNSEYTAWLNTL